MMKGMLGKVMWVGKGTVFVVGLAVILAAIMGTASMAFAANGKPFILGQNNVATAITTLTKQGPGPALRLLVAPGQPPMAVNSAVKVANLNSDKVDGQDSSAFLPRGGKAADSDRLDGLDSTAFARNSFYKTEGVIDEGLLLGDGTHKAIAFCEPGDRLLSGGPANIDKETTLLESFPAPGTIGSGTQFSWTVRVNKQGFTDTFNVVVLCVDQFNP